MLYALVPNTSSLISATELQIEKEKCVVQFASVDPVQVVGQFMNKCQHHRENVVISSTPQLEDDVLRQLIEEFINSSGGAYSLFAARELNEEPKCLLSGDFLCSEVVAKSSLEVIQYFKQATRTRESLGINIPALMSLHRNGKTLNFVINPPAQMASIKQLNIYPKCFLLLLGSAPSDAELIKLAKFIQTGDEGKRATSRRIRQNLHELNKEMSRQTVPDENKRNQLKGLLKTLNYASKEGVDEVSRVAQARRFMEQREHRLQQNGLMWSLNEENTDIERLLSLEYQKLRRDLENARFDLGEVKAAGGDRLAINAALIKVREHEAKVASCEAKIANSSVNSLHYQLKAERDQLRMEQMEQLKQAQAKKKSENELLVIHVEAQKRLIERLERDAETVIQHHQHFMDELKMKQIAVMQKYRQLMESAASDRIQRIENLLHESITDALVP